jgi:hypothetical protein
MGKTSFGAIVSKLFDPFFPILQSRIVQKRRMLLVSNGDVQMVDSISTMRNDCSAGYFKRGDLEPFMPMGKDTYQKSHMFYTHIKRPLECVPNRQRLV